jgi:hypothetical protein
MFADLGGTTLPSLEVIECQINALLVFRAVFVTATVLFAGANFVLSQLSSIHYFNFGNFAFICGVHL